MEETEKTYLEFLNQVNEECRTEIDWEVLFNAVNLDCPNKLIIDILDKAININRIKAYEFSKYIVDNKAICGITTIFLDDTLVATTTKKYPKHREEVEFLNSESYRQLKKYLFELALEYDYPHEDTILFKHNRKTKGTYLLYSIDELCHKYAFLGDDIVEIPPKEYKSENGMVKVVKKDNTIVEVDIKELTFKYNMP